MSGEWPAASYNAMVRSAPMVSLLARSSRHYRLPARSQQAPPSSGDHRAIACAIHAAHCPHPIQLAPVQGCSRGSSFRPHKTVVHGKLALAIKRDIGSCPPELFFVEDQRPGFELLYCDFELMETSVDHFGRTILPFELLSERLVLSKKFGMNRAFIIHHDSGFLMRWTQPEVFTSGIRTVHRLKCRVAAQYKLRSQAGARREPKDLLLHKHEIVRGNPMRRSQSRSHRHPPTDRPRAPFGLGVSGHNCHESDLAH